MPEKKLNILVTSVIDLEVTTYSRLHRFLDYLTQKGHTVTVLSIKDYWKKTASGQNKELVNKLTIKHVTKKKESVLMQKLKAKLNNAKAISDQELKNFDIHFCYNSMILGNAIIKRCQKLKIPTVYDLADDLPEMVKIHPSIPSFMQGFAASYAEKLLKENLALADVTTASARDFERTMKLENYVYIPNGVDPKLFKPKKPKHKGFVVGYLGALREWVDLRPMLLAVKQLDKKDISVLVVGGEEDLEQYKKFVEEKKIGRVTFTGNIPHSEVPDKLAEMDVGTMPFKKNRVTDGTCPVKVFEYMAMQKPVISTSLNEIRTVGEDKVLYADTIEEWAKQINLLYCDPILKESLGMQGYEHVLKKFDWDKLCKELEETLVRYSQK